MPDPASAAPAQSASVEQTPSPTAPPLSATEQAVVDHDFSAFEHARSAEDTGKPLAPAAPAVTNPDDADPSATPASPDRAVSKRQQQINEYERTIAEQKQRIRALEEKPPATDTRPPAPAPAARTETQPPHAPALPPPPAELQTFDAYVQAHPDATYETYVDARAAWRVDATLQAHARAGQQRAREQSRAQHIQERQRGFFERITAAGTTPEQLFETLSPDVRGLVPTSDLPPGTAPTPLNDLAEEMFEDLDLSLPLLRHLSDHPEDMARFARMPNRRAFYQALGQLKSSLAVPAPPTTKPVSSAPPPTTTLGSRPDAPADPIRASVMNDDYSAFEREADRQDLARLGR